MNQNKFCIMTSTWIDAKVVCKCKLSVLGRPTFVLAAGADRVGCVLGSFRSCLRLSFAAFLPFRRLTVATVRLLHFLFFFYLFIYFFTFCDFFFFSFFRVVR